MREYLFRGKRKDNGEWVYWNIYGDFCTLEGEKTKYKRKAANGEVNLYYIYDYLIDHETIGQYIGKTDKNGKKIFEGDIVAMPAYVGGKHKAVVYFKGGKFAVDGSNYGFKDIAPKRMKVIGNIYDNKEILDVK